MSIFFISKWKQFLSVNNNAFILSIIINQSIIYTPTNILWRFQIASNNICTVFVCKFKEYLADDYSTFIKTITTFGSTCNHPYNDYYFHGKKATIRFIDHYLFGHMMYQVNHIKIFFVLMIFVNYNCTRRDQPIFCSSVILMTFWFPVSSKSLFKV